MHVDTKDANRGLYQKYRVERTDGRDQPGEEHDGCQCFTLDLDHDPYAIDALIAYASACEVRFPALARDLWRIVDAKAPLRRPMS